MYHYLVTADSITFISY